MNRVEQRLEALDAFKDWSNYLLVTTAAALGWIAKDDNFSTSVVRGGAIVCFALSIVFAILTLALIPHVAQGIRAVNDSVKPDQAAIPSIYRVYWKGWGLELRLTRLCFPQHLLFLMGVLLYASGTAFSDGWKALVSFASMLVGGLLLVYLAGWVIPSLSKKFSAGGSNFVKLEIGEGHRESC